MKKLFLFSCLIYISFSCKKKEVEVLTNRFDLITSNTSKIWILNNITTNGKSIIDECAKDDEYEFVKASLTINYEPILKCYENDLSKVLGYKMSTDQKSILIDGVLYTIDEISNSKMILSHDGSDGARISENNSILHAQQTLTLVAK